jgi:hypothetical protein
MITSLIMFTLAIYLYTQYGGWYFIVAAVFALIAMIIEIILEKWDGKL